MNIKRNNPGNLRPSAQKWQGEITRSGEKYCEFATLEWGCRAMLKLLSTYRKKYKLTTIEGIVKRWAPPSDGNNTKAYIDYVSNRLRVQPNEYISSSRDIVLAQAMSRMETGKEVPLEFWERASAMI